MDGQRYFTIAQKQSLTHHPDRLKNPTEKERLAATERFQTVADACMITFSFHFQMRAHKREWQTTSFLTRIVDEHMIINELPDRRLADTQQTIVAAPVPTSSAPSSVGEGLVMRMRMKMRNRVQEARAPDLMRTS